MFSIREIHAPIDDQAIIARRFGDPDTERPVPERDDVPERDAPEPNFLPIVELVDLRLDQRAFEQTEIRDGPVEILVGCRVGSPRRAQTQERGRLHVERVPVARTIRSQVPLFDAVDVHVFVCRGAPTASVHDREMDPLVRLEIRRDVDVVPTEPVP